MGDYRREGKMNNVTEQTPHPCYWCGKETKIKKGINNDLWIRCDEENCRATGPSRETEAGAILAWNSLAARLKPAPKKVTVKRFVNVYDIQGDILTSDTYASRDDALCAANEFLKDVRKSGFFDTVEVEIHFTDRRGCE